MSETPFNVILQQAAALKTAQMAVDRTRYDSWDSWYQHSLFAKEDVRQIRLSSSAVKKVGFARECKNQGSNLFREQRYEEAINEYERCLSVFDWAESTDPEWKKKGIQDKTITQCSYRGEDAEDPTEAAREIHELKLACILNLSMCFWKLSAWAECVRACDRALQLDPDNTKALYRRAQARIVPASCGTTENLLALADLKKAVALRPDDSMLTSAYAELKISLSEQKKKDKKTFAHLFERQERSPEAARGQRAGGGERKANEVEEAEEEMVPAPSKAARGRAAAAAANTSTAVNTGTIASSSSSSSSSSAARKPAEEKKKALTWQDAFDMVRDMQAAAQRCEAEGRHAQAAAIRARQDELRRQMMVYFPKNVQSEMEKVELEGQDGCLAIEEAAVAAAAGLGGAAGRKKRSRAAKAGASPGTWDGLARTCSRETTEAGEESPASWYEVCGASEYDLVDFSRPTPSMIRDAQSKGLDLTDPRVQQLMQEINKVRIRHAREDAARLKGKAAPKESKAEHARRMEGYMREALRNIHAEEAGRITTTLLTDVSVKTQRKMLATRLKFLQLEREEEGEEAVALDDEVGEVGEEDGVGGKHGAGRAADQERREALGELASAFEAAVAVDPAACSAEELAGALRAMMVADIVQLRQVLEREAQELRDLRKLKAESTRAGALRRKKAAPTDADSRALVSDPGPGAGAGAGDGTLLEQEVAAAEERARLTLSEEIVDMLEAKYGTAQHSGEAVSTASTLARSAAIAGGIACAVLIILNIVMRLLLSAQSQLPGFHPAPGASGLGEGGHL